MSGLPILISCSEQVTTIPGTRNRWKEKLYLINRPRLRGALPTACPLLQINVASLVSCFCDPGACTSGVG